MNKGIIYLIQPCELLGTSRYKIGCSTNLELERIKNGYKKGTRYIIIMECYDPFFLEKNIKRVFNEKFKLIAGNEYFEGDEKNIKDEFLKIVIEYEKENKVDEKENIDILFCNLDDQIIISKQQKEKAILEQQKLEQQKEKAILAQQKLEQQKEKAILAQQKLEQQKLEQQKFENDITTNFMNEYYKKTMNEKDRILVEDIYNDYKNYILSKGIKKQWTEMLFRTEMKKYEKKFYSEYKKDFCLCDLKKGDPRRGKRGVYVCMIRIKEDEEDEEIQTKQKIDL